MESTNKRDIDRDLIKKHYGHKVKEMKNVVVLKWAEMDKELEPFLNVIDRLRDREFAILSSSLLDDYLEAIITDSYIKDRRVKSIFKDEHILQSFYTKINIAYFSGLIPKWLYDDLRLICQIRNKFAHKFITDLDFNNELITRKIDQCELRPKTLDGIKAPRLKMMIVVMQTVALLKYIHALLNMNLPHLMDIHDMNSFDYESLALVKEDIDNIAKKLRKIE